MNVRELREALSGADDDEVVLLAPLYRNFGRYAKVSHITIGKSGVDSKNDTLKLLDECKGHAVPALVIWY